MQGDSAARGLLASSVMMEPRDEPQVTLLLSPDHNKQWETERDACIPAGG